MNEWSRRVGALRHVGTIAREAFVVGGLRTLGFDLDRRYIAWSTNWENGGLGIADLRTGRVLLEDGGHQTLKVVPLHGGFASQNHATKTLTVFRIDERGKVETFESSSLGERYFESITASGDRVFLRGNAQAEIVAWPSFERIAAFKGYGMEIDWDARRVLRRRSTTGINNDAIEILDLEGEEITALPILAFGSLSRLAPGLWARASTGLRILDIADGRDASILLASRGRITPPSLSADRRGLRLMVRGKPRRIELDPFALTAQVPEDLASAVRVAGSDAALFHPHADLFADHRPRLGWTIRAFDGTPVLSLREGVPMTWSDDGEVLLVVRQGFIHVWQ